jgi:hypothetical protein
MKMMSMVRYTYFVKLKLPCGSSLAFDSSDSFGRLLEGRRVLDALEALLHVLGELAPGSDAQSALQPRSVDLFRSENLK